MPSEHTFITEAPRRTVLRTDAEKTAAFARCVFIREGAYGEHITADEQASLSRDAVQKLARMGRESWHDNFEMAVLEGRTVSYDIIIPNCVVEIRDPQGRSLLLEGSSMD